MYKLDFKTIIHNSFRQLADHNLNFMSEVQKTEAIELTNLKPGMVVKVYEKIKDIDAKGKERTRSQIFEGTVLAVKNSKTSMGSFVVRKISEGVGVEKIYPLQSPLIEKIIFVKQIKVNRAKLYYLRNYKKRLKEKKVIKVKKEV